MKQNKPNKYELDPEIRKKLLASQELIGRVADLSSDDDGKPLQFQTIKKRLENNLPVLTTVESMDIIKRAMGLPAERVIYVAIKSR